jgi:hypothetical protein
MVNYYIKYLKYKTKYLNLKGGKYLSKGVDGIVYRPPLFCIDRETKYENENYIGKIMEKDKADDEFQKSNKVKELDPEDNWSITIDKICLLNNEQIDEDYLKNKNNFLYKDKNTQLISKYGGVSLAKGFLEYDDTFKKNATPDKIPLFFKLLKTQLVPIIIELNKKYAHNDLHLDNILYNNSDGKIRIFDFGKLISIGEKKGYLSNSDFEDLYFHLDPIIRCIIYKKWFEPEMKAYIDKRKTILLNPNEENSFTTEQYIEAILALPDLPLH